MSRKLPVLDAAPTLEQARRRLGGLAHVTDRVGCIVADPAGAFGVVIHAEGGELDVVMTTTAAGGGTVVRRGDSTRWSEVSDSTASARALAETIRAFARIEVGARVVYRDRGRVAEGTFVERCRYGALVATASGSIVAVGFGALGRPSN